MSINYFALFSFILLGINTDAAEDRTCKSRNYGYDSIVCVCDTSYCDQPLYIPFPDIGTFAIVTSSRDGQRFDIDVNIVLPLPNPGAVMVEVKQDEVYQTITGFGGSFTDSAAMNIASLSSETKDHLLRSYFSAVGIKYELCRIPIAGTDFSVRPYSYDDVEGDTDLEHFALADEDIDYKIPLILQAKDTAARTLKLVASPWSSPAWMKTNGKFNESGELLKEMWHPWSNYFVKFVNAYESAGVDLWGLTTQNEPITAGFDNETEFVSLGWTAENMRDWIKTSLGPTLEKAGLRQLKLLVGDDTRKTLPWYPQTIMEDPDAAQYIDGTAVHWYADYIRPSVLDEVQELFPDKFLLYTEACEGFDVTAPEDVELGQWSRGENYAHSIIESINHFSTGWIDWNLALDMNGGPSWIKNYVDSPIIINKEADEFYKQPTYYVMGHFSKFVPHGSKRIHSSSEDEEVEVVAFKHYPDDDRIAMVLLNKGENMKHISVKYGTEATHYLNFQIPGKAIQTLLF